MHLLILIKINADSAEARAQEILSGLGFSEKQQYSPMASLSSLSGGWRMVNITLKKKFIERFICYIFSYKTLIIII